MIPKIIHYCWFGGNPLPPLAIKCIESWKKFFPDYEIKEWNESNFDVNIIAYTAEAYRLKKYAFVSDYARFWILYHYGGLYFDTDVEIIKDMQDIVDKGAFMGCEMTPDGDGFIPMIATGLAIGAEAGNDVYKIILNHYENNHLVKWNGRITSTVVDIVTDILIGNANIDLYQIVNLRGITIYPSDYFCPIVAKTRIKTITKNTRSIHHFTATWMNQYKGPIDWLRVRIKRISTFVWGRFLYSKH